VCAARAPAWPAWKLFVERQDVHNAPVGRRGGLTWPLSGVSGERDDDVRVAA
jgi:hypothetical protein